MNRYLMGPIFAAAALLLASCTDAGLCERGSLGCACKAEGECLPGAVCSEDGLCVQALGTDAGQVDPDDCAADTKAEACRVWCLATCGNMADSCATSRCPTNACQPGGAMHTLCMNDLCGSEGVACIEQECRQQANVVCETFGAFYSCEESDPECPIESLCIEKDPTCVLLPERGCSDICGDATTLGTGGELVGNGMCEDGGEGSISDACRRGTDCSDCGARLACAEVGQQCGNRSDCCGDAVQCVRERTGDPGYCRKTCEPPDIDCPVGETCHPTAAVCIPL